MNMKKIYRKIAKDNGISVAEVKKEMQKAINTAYAKPNFYAGCVERQNEIPTPEELITHFSNRADAFKNNR